MLAFLIKYDKISVMEATEDKKRIYLLDEIRGLAVFCMVLYHGYWLAGGVFGLAAGKKLFEFFMPAEPFFAGIFIFVCGLSCLLSRSNLRRGLRIAAAAAAFTVFTCVILPLFGVNELGIRFGILHFLGVCVLLYTLTEKGVKKVPPYAGAFLCILLYLFFSGLRGGVLGDGNLIKIPLPAALYESDWLMPIGIHSPSFDSADYFPVLPNVFMFFFGVFCGRLILHKGFPSFAYKERIRFLGWLGRHAFIIYVTHFPALAGICFVLTKIFNK